MPPERQPATYSLRGGERQPADSEPIIHSSTTSTGLPLEEQVRKGQGGMDPHKGGLPTFCRQLRGAGPVEEDTPSDGIG
jgi:hypothetical protein